MYDNLLYGAYGYLTESDDKLRRLERSALNKAPESSSVKRYIAELARVQGSREAVATLIRDFKVLPRVTITYHFEPETIRPEDTMLSITGIDWVYRELAKGNVYAWCNGTIRVDWFVTSMYYGLAYLAAISARDRKNAISVLEDLLPEAIDDLIIDLGYPASPYLVASRASEHQARLMLKAYLNGQRNKTGGWVSYDD